MTPHPAFAKNLAAQRTWVDITEEEIEEIFDRWPTYHLDHEEFARAVLAKSKEKNT
jgi:hypothetical protein